MTTGGNNGLSASQLAMCKALTDAFAVQYGDCDGVQLVMAPGRVNLLGEHTDYNDGFVLPMTVDRGVYVACRARPDRRVRFWSRRFDERIDFRLGEAPATARGAWSCYVVGVVEELATSGQLERGIDAVIDGDLEPGAGLSSSAALEVAVALSLERVGGFEIGGVETARLCKRVEHDYAGVRCGIMDPFASRMGLSGQALFLDCRSLDYRHVPLALGDYRVVIISSGVRRALSDSAYNARRAECGEALAHFQSAEPDIAALRDVTDAMLAAHETNIDPLPFRRCRHVVSENRRVEAAIECLEAGDHEAFGRLMSESHRSLREDFEVSSVELDWLVDAANETDGVLGSRMTGAGFGGCTVSIAHVDSIPALAARIASAYAGQFNRRARTFVIETNLEAGPLG